MDTIADMLTIIRNSLSAGKEDCLVPFSNLKWELAKLFQEQNRIKKVEKISKDDKPYLKLTLDYVEGKPKIETLKRISKPGRRKYIKVDEIYPSEFGFTVLSTPKGVLTDQQAKEENSGGEVICKVR